MPSLEWLQQSGEKALWSSAAFLTVGVVSGIAINFMNRMQGDNIVTWFDPVVWTSAFLLTWLLVSLAFNWWYQPVRQGRRVSYLVMFCFLFFVLEIGLVLYSRARHRSQRFPIRQCVDQRWRANMILQIVGCSHHQSSVNIRERLAFNDEQAGRFLESFLRCVSKF